MNLAQLYEKLEKLAERLPKQLQSPLLQKVRPIKTLFLQQRAPRLLLLGARTASRSALVNALFSDAVAHAGEDLLQDGTWQLFTSGRGKLRMLDARRPVSLAMLRRALAAEPPDLCLFLQGGPRASAEIDDDLQRAREVLQTTSEIPVIGVGTATTPETAEQSRAALHEALDRGPANPLAGHIAGAYLLGLGEKEVHRLATATARRLPDEAKLEMARLSGVRELQLEVANALVSSVSALCGAIGAQPIPLADFPILTALQATMVAGVMHISGRELSMKLGAQWIAALGANIGAALVLREGTRAVLKLVPFWGDLVSGGIAAAGTFAIGKAATAYFIEGVSLTDAQRLFRERKKAPAKLK